MTLLYSVCFSIYKVSDNKLLRISKKNTKCQVKNCENTPLKKFCEAHIKNPVIENLKFSDAISVMPSIFKKKSQLPTDFQLSNALVNAIIKTKRREEKSTLKRLKSSVIHNNSIESRSFIKVDFFLGFKKEGVILRDSLCTPIFWEDFLQGVFYMEGLSLRCILYRGALPPFNLFLKISKINLLWSEVQEKKLGEAHLILAFWNLSICKFEQMFLILYHFCPFLL